MSEMNKLDWKGYEFITKYIYETLGKEFGIKIEGYGKDFKVIGKSGVKHQIDVLTSSSDGQNKYLTAIECKFWRKKINKDTVMKVSKIIEDAGINKGIIVSKSGYTPDAVNFAKYSNIGLVELHERDNNDSKSGPENLILGTITISQHITLRRPEIISISVDYLDKVAIQKERITRYGYTILFSDGRRIPLDFFAKSFQSELHDKNKLFQIINRHFEFSGERLIKDENGTSEKIKGITFTGVLRKIESNSNKEFSLIDQVWLIMESLFEERSFVISENGIINESER